MASSCLPVQLYDYLIRLSNKRETLTLSMSVQLYDYLIRLSNPWLARVLGRKVQLYDYLIRLSNGPAGVHLKCGFSYTII